MAWVRWVFVGLVTAAWAAAFVLWLLSRLGIGDPEYVMPPWIQSLFGIVVAYVLARGGGEDESGTQGQVDRDRPGSGAVRRDRDGGGDGAPGAGRDGQGPGGGGGEPSGHRGQGQGRAEAVVHRGAGRGRPPGDRPGDRAVPAAAA